MNSTPKPATCRFLPAVRATVVAALLASCGGGDADKAPAGADIETLQAEADEALEQAKKLGLEKLAPEEYGKAKKQIDDAATAAEAGDPKKAATKYKSAAKALDRLVEEQKQVVGEKAKVASGEKAAAAAAKQKADAAKAATNAPTMYAEAADYQKKGEDLLASAATKKAVVEARQSLSRARDLFEQSGKVAAENEIDRKRFEEEKKALEDVKAMAKKSGAEEKAAAEWLAAGQAERDAQALFDRGDFRAAIEQLKQTAGVYQSALSRVATDAQIAEMVAKGEEDAKAWQKKSEEEEKQRRADEAAMREQKEKELAAKAEARRKTVAAGKDGRKGMSAAIVPFDEFDPESYPQEIDDEDRAFLDEHYPKLTKSGNVQYDPASGFVRLNYIVGKDVERDVERIFLPKPEYLTFEDPLMKGVKFDDPKEREKNSAYSFSGNTQGLVAFPVPFRYYVRVEYDMWIGTMNQVSSFSNILMYDVKKKTGYMTDWAKLGMMNGSAFKAVKACPVPQYNGSANEWHVKIRGVPYFLEYKWLPPSEGKKESGVFKFDLDVGQTEGAQNQMASARFTRGQVGFKWGGVKFTIRNLIITGILDKEAAVAQLRKLTGIKKSGGAAEKPEKKDKKKKATETAQKPETKKTAEGGEKDGTEKTGTEKNGAAKNGAKKAGDFDF